MYRIFSEPLCVERVTVTIRDLPKSLQGTKLSQLSDLHYDGFRLSARELAEAIEVSNQAEPDLVVLTGDFVTDDPTPVDQLVQQLKHLKSRAGIYAILGNHDLYYYHSKQRVIEALTSVGIRVLWNEVAYPLGSELALVGLADFWSSEFAPSLVLDHLDDTIPRIVLSHNPDTAEILRQWRVDLQLSGHTHGGQIVIPEFGPAAILIQELRALVPPPLRPLIPFMKECSKVVQHWEWAQGLHQLGKNQLYVNRGLGTYAPGRLFCPPEVTIITLV